MEVFYVFSRCVMEEKIEYPYMIYRIDSRLVVKKLGKINDSLEIKAKIIFVGKLVHVLFFIILITHQKLAIFRVLLLL